MVNAKETTSVRKIATTRTRATKYDGIQKAIKVPEIFADLIPEFTRILT
jgi:hypothetical protein